MRKPMTMKEPDVPTTVQMDQAIALWTIAEHLARIADALEPKVVIKVKGEING